MRTLFVKTDKVDEDSTEEHKKKRRKESLLESRH